MVEFSTKREKHETASKIKTAEAAAVFIFDIWFHSTITSYNKLLHMFFVYLPSLYSSRSLK